MWSVISAHPVGLAQPVRLCSEYHTGLQVWAGTAGPSLVILLLYNEGGIFKAGTPGRYHIRSVVEDSGHLASHCSAGPVLQAPITGMRELPSLHQQML